MTDGAGALLPRRCHAVSVYRPRSLTETAALVLLPVRCHSRPVAWPVPMQGRPDRLLRRRRESVPLCRQSAVALHRSQRVWRSTRCVWSASAASLRKMSSIGARKARMNGYPLTRNTVLQQGDEISTKSQETPLTIAFADNSTVTIRTRSSDQSLLLLYRGGCMYAPNCF